MKKKNISDALNNIDFDMVEDVYECTKTNKRKRKSIWLKWGAIAACLCVIVAVATLLPILNSDQSNPNDQFIPTTPDKLNLVGDVLRTGDSTLTYHTDNFSEHTLAFTMVLENEFSSCYVVFSAHNVLKQWTDDNGVVNQETEWFKIITPCASFESNVSYTVVDDALTILVNGETAKTLPTQPGTYEIVIDYDELYNRYDLVDESVDIWPFGDIVINCEKFQ